MVRPTSLSLICIVAVLLAGIAGCGNDGLPKTGSVTGTIKLNGEPIEGVQLEFTPTEKQYLPAKYNADAAKSSDFNLDVKEGGLVFDYDIKYTGAAIPEFVAPK